MKSAALDLRADLCCHRISVPGGGHYFAVFAPDITGEYATGETAADAWWNAYSRLMRFPAERAVGGSA